MAFLKTCYVCGTKTKNLYNSKCEDCFKEEHPPIADLKPLNVKFCNKCMKIYYNNQLITREEFENRLPNIVKKNITIDKNYNLNTLEIKDFKIKGQTVSFDINVDCSLK